MTRVKICGVTSHADRDAVVAAGADAFGVIVDVPVETPRSVDAETAAALVDRAPPFVTSVLVTMPDSVQAAIRLNRAVGADAIQVHDRLPPAYVGGLAERTTADVVAVTAADAPDAESYAAAADALLVDTVGPAGGGGTGETVDWDRTARLIADLDTPVVLAGGLTPQTVADAVRRVRPYAVDVATGVERAGGEKDHEAVRSFVERAHAEGAS